MDRPASPVDRSDDGSAAEPLSARLLADTVLAELRTIADTRAGAVAAAADLLLPVVAGGGIIHAFGTGHSQAAAMELAGRAGGLVPTNRLSLTDLVLRGGLDPSVLHDPLLERRADMVPALLAIADARPGDAFVVISNSGVNASIVELALAVVDRGLPLVAVTSLAHTNAVASLHPSGRRLADVADVVLDNGAPPGDRLLEHAPGRSVGALSLFSSALLIQMVVAEVVARIVAAGGEPPVYVSANVPGGHERNLAIEARYAGRLHRIAG